MVFIPQVHDNIILEGQNPYSRLRREDSENEPFSIELEMGETGRETPGGESPGNMRFEATAVLGEGEVDSELTLYEGHGTVMVGWLLGTKLDVTV